MIWCIGPLCKVCPCRTAEDEADVSWGVLGLCILRLLGETAEGKVGGDGGVPEYNWNLG